MQTYQEVLEGEENGSLVLKTTICRLIKIYLWSMTDLYIKIAVIIVFLCTCSYHFLRDTYM